MGELKEKYFRSVVLLGLTGVITGSLFANIYCSDNVGEWGVFNYSFIEKMQGIDFDKKELFEYVMWERLKLWGVFFLLSFTKLRMILEPIFILFWGFFSGLTCSTTVMEFGLKGVLYYLLLALVAQLFLVMSIICAMQYGKFICRKNEFAGNAPWLVFSVVFLLCSVVSEVLFNINITKIFN